MTADLPLAEYYARRAPEYERIWRSLRRLEDGTEREVLKNFPETGELEAQLQPFATDLQVRLLPHYWCLSYRLRMNPSENLPNSAQPKGGLQP